MAKKTGRQWAGTRPRDPLTDLASQSDALIIESVNMISKCWIERVKIGKAFGSPLVLADEVPWARRETGSVTRHRSKSLAIFHSQPARMRVAAS